MAGATKVKSSKDVGRALAVKTFRRRLQLFFTNWLFWAFLLLFVWVLGGTIFYMETMDWTSSEGFYFACQAGLSVGFGAEEINLSTASDGVHIFTVFYVLLGSSAIAAALAVFIESMLDKQEKYYREAMHKQERQKYDFSDAVANVYMQARSHATQTITLIIFFLWISFGVIFGMLYEDYSFSVSLLFAVAALSTGGLVAPSNSNTAMWFTGWYVLTGVPIYAFTLGQIAGLIVEYRAKQKFKADLSAKITEEEFEYANALEDEGDGEVDWSEFLQMTMLRLGKISKSELDKIRQRFNELDVNKDGRFSRLEMNLALAFDKWDKDGSGELDIDEWVGLCTQLNRKYHCFGDVSDMEAAFREIDVDGGGRVSREEFFKLFHKLYGGT